MSTNERAHSLIDMMTEDDLLLVINLFGRLYDIPEETNEEDDMEERRKAFESILADRPNGSVVVDDRQELLDYLDERYGTGL